MARRPGSSIRSRRLAITLRKLRNTAGLTTMEAARKLDMSQSKISRMESAEIGFYRDDLEKLLELYRVPETARVELLELARHAEERGQTRLNNPNLPAAWQTWVDLEDEATTLLSYQSMTLPGMLQTAEYASAIIRATGDELTDRQVDELVASRMGRQSALSRTTPLRLHVLLEEDVLFRPFGRPGALYRQLRHLVDAATRENITFQLLRRDAELHSGMAGPFAILEYDGEPSLVLLENKVGSQIIDDEEQIASYVRSWRELIELAASPEETVELVNDMIASLD